MKTLMNIPPGYSSSQAARQLGISQHEVARLVRTGTLTAQKLESGMYVVDPGSVQGLAQSRAAKGRPWDAETAWAALLLLDGEDSIGLNYHKSRRLRSKLATCLLYTSHHGNHALDAGLACAVHNPAHQRLA